MPKLAWLFPGQGAQAVGMGKAFYDRYDVSRDLYHRANTHLGFDVASLCFEGPLEELTKTEQCQPALFVTSLAAVAAWHAVEPSRTPSASAGLSLGELTALAAADAFRFTDGLYLVQARAAAMAECAAQNRGAMLAVLGLSREAIAEVCEASGAVMANVNAPDQLVLSGSVEVIERAEASAKAKGAKRALRLDVAGAFHSPLMQPASERFRKALEKVVITPPSFPVISNVTGRPVVDPEEIRRLLVRQIVSPVLWEPSMRYLLGEGVTSCVEFPPARILTGLLRKIDPAVKCLPVGEPADFDKLK